MRIDKLHLENFKCFEKTKFEFHPNFNLIIGENASGKTSLLDALSIAIGSWLLGIRGFDSRHIHVNEIRTVAHQLRNSISFERLPNTSVSVDGYVMGEFIAWSRALEHKNYDTSPRTTSKDAKNVEKLASIADTAVRKGEPITLPIISYYGTGRLWQEPRSKKMNRKEYNESISNISSKNLIGKEGLSRLEGYRNSVDPRVSTKVMIDWVFRETLVSIQNERRSEYLEAFLDAIVGCIENAISAKFFIDRGEIILFIKGKEPQPFSNLSDGQRAMFAMIADITQKIAKLNPHLGKNILKETPGVVLIDELDLHLHPKWQRRVIEDLKRTFPKIQFFATTHSPFIIQSLTVEDKLILLDREIKSEYVNQGLEEIVRFIMGVDSPELSERYKKMKDTATEYFKLLDEGKNADPKRKEELKELLSRLTAPYSENPAYVAFLERKRLVSGVDQ